MTEQKQQVQQAVTEAVKQEAEKKAGELVSGLLGGKTNQPSKVDSARRDSVAKPEDFKKKAVDEGVKAIQNLLKKRKTNGYDCNESDNHRVDPDCFGHGSTVVGGAPVGLLF